jgi:hypothetical protein
MLINNKIKYFTLLNYIVCFISSIAILVEFTISNIELYKSIVLKLSINSIYYLYM